MKLPLFAASLLALLCTSAPAQIAPPSNRTPSHQEFSIQASGDLTRKITSNGVTYRPDPSMGVFATYRYNFMHWLGAEAEYNYQQTTQVYTVAGAKTSIDADAHALGAAAVFQFSNPLAKSIRSFVTVGGGATLFEPRNAPGLPQQWRNTILIGGGEDIPLSRRLLVRIQISSATYKAPDFGFTTLHTNKYMQTVTPAAGLAFRF